MPSARARQQRSAAAAAAAAHGYPPGLGLPHHPTPRHPSQRAPTLSPQQRARQQAAEENERAMWQYLIGLLGLRLNHQPWAQAPTPRHQGSPGMNARPRQESSPAPPAAAAASVGVGRRAVLTSSRHMDPATAAASLPPAVAAAAAAVEAEWANGAGLQLESGGWQAAAHTEGWHPPPQPLPPQQQQQTRVPSHSQERWPPQQHSTRQQIQAAVQHEGQGRQGLGQGQGLTRQGPVTQSLSAAGAGTRPLHPPSTPTQAAARLAAVHSGTPPAPAAPAPAPAAMVPGALPCPCAAVPSAAKAECQEGVADVGELCWVCFAGAGPGEGGQLFSPCTVCRGSLRSLHRACFHQWLVSSWALACPNCARGYSRDVLEGLVEGRMLLQVLDGLLQGQAELAPPAAPPAEPLPPSAALPGDRVADGWGAVSSSSSGHPTRAHHDQGGSGSSGSTAPDPATHPIPGSAEVVSGREGVGAGARGRGGGGGGGEGASRLHPDVWQQRFPEGTEVVFTLAQAVQVSLPAEQLTVPGGWGRPCLLRWRCCRRKRPGPGPAHHHACRAPLRP
ncbi:hypothetical protein V8C86DRAFT_515970 [Haematococcus lacustris]